MSLELESRLRKAVLEAIETAVTRVPRDVWEALVQAYRREHSDRAREILGTILESIKVAARDRIPLCQDTGLPVFFVEIGEEFPLKRRALDIITESVREATKLGILRPNAVDPVRNINSGDNTGRWVPLFEVQLIDGDRLKITYVPKGGGSEYVSKLHMVTPSRGLEELKKRVIDAVVDAGPKPCPPVFVSIGIAGTADMAERLSRLSLARRRVSERHRDPDVARLELELLEKVNSLGIGPAGLGGDTTALDLWIEYGHRHPATFAIAITFSCWALRRASIEIDRYGNVYRDPIDFWEPPG